MPAKHRTHRPGLRGGFSSSLYRTYTYSGSLSEELTAYWPLHRHHINFAHDMQLALSMQLMRTMHLAHKTI